MSQSKKLEPVCAEVIAFLYLGCWEVGGVLIKTKTILQANNFRY